MGHDTDQYADDTTNFDYCKPAQLPAAIKDLSSRFSQMIGFSNTNNLAFNEKKTKVMLITTSRISKIHNLNDPANETSYQASLTTDRESVQLQTSWHSL